jgi:hypothetical protein
MCPGLGFQLGGFLRGDWIIRVLTSFLGEWTTVRWSLVRENSSLGYVFEGFVLSLNPSCLSAS